MSVRKMPTPIDASAAKESPTIQTTLGQLSVAEPALKRLAEEKLSFQTAYRVAKLAKAVAEETKHFIDQRNALVKEFGEKKPGGSDEDIQVSPSMPSWKIFVSKMDELAAVPVTIPLWPLDLTKIEDLKIAATDLLLLDTLVVLEAEAKPEV